MMRFLPAPALALAIAACTQAGHPDARFVLVPDPLDGSSVAPIVRPAASEPAPGTPAPVASGGHAGGQPSADGSPGSGGPPATGGGRGGSGGSGGGAAASPPNGLSLATERVFSLAWLAGRATGGPAPTDDRQAWSFGEVAGLVVTDDGTAIAVDRAVSQIVALPAGRAPQVLCGAADGATGFWGDDLPASASALDQPAGIARDRVSGVLYVADAGNRRIRHFMPGGRIYTLAGGGPDAADDVPDAQDAQLGTVQGLALDAQGRAVFTEPDTGRLRRVRADGALETLLTVGPGLGVLAIAAAGDRGWVAMGDRVERVALGAAPALLPVAGFAGKRITGLAFDELDTLYVATADAVGAAQIVAVPLDAVGARRTARPIAVVAGSGAVPADPVAEALPATALADAITHPLPQRGFGALAIDLTHAADPALVAGQLYLATRFLSMDGTVRWSQVALLEPR